VLVKSDPFLNAFVISFIEMALGVFLEVARSSTGGLEHKGELERKGDPS